MANATVGPVELHYEEFGDGNDPPLLMVMGLGAQMIVWPDELCQGLVDRGFRVIRFDNRDVGMSTWFDGVEVDMAAAVTAGMMGQPFDGAPYNLSDMAADAIGLLDHLDISQANIVGASMGGMIVQTMAIEHGDRIASLCSIMSNTGNPEFGAPTPDAMGALLSPGPTEREAAIEHSVGVSKVISSAAHFDEDDVRARAAAHYDRGFNPEGVTRQVAAIMASGSREEGLQALDLPTLVIHGAQDPLITPTGGERTAELVPDAELLMLEEMAHDLPIPLWGPIISSITSNVIRVA
ncbi:MAG: alpha/beta fold hydrolase [Actinomycetia bacterium]|nr:alpha/beta fold hydrolase [Actinomycetes bacterium]